MHMKHFRLVIPSWAPLSVEMRAETGQHYPANILVRGMPLYCRIAEMYGNSREVVDIRMVLSEQAPELDHAMSDAYHISETRLGTSTSIGMTVLAALDELQAHEGVVVHMADTLLGKDYAPLMDVVYVQPRTDLYRWTSMCVQEDNSLKVVNDRNEDALVGERNVCVGIFAFSDGLRFKRELSKSLAQPVVGIDPIFSAIEAYSRQILIRLHLVDEWYDYGHVDTYHESRLRFQNLRHFNELTYDPLRNVITKKSKHIEAFRHQVRWYRQIPDDLAYFLPRIYDSSDGDEPSISMEFMSIPTLSELFVGDRLEIGAWNGVARKLSEILKLMDHYAFRSKLAEKLAEEVYIEKTQRRIRDFLTQSPQASGWWVWSGGRRVDLAYVCEMLHAYSHSNSLTSVDRLTPIHGDLCFSNILYDHRVRQIKLIDPRGEFGVPGIYGDPRYDLAKLLHSYHGGYDFIVSDRFTARLDTSGELQCEFMDNQAWRHKITNILDEQLFSDPVLKQQCQAIEALLFLSMLPLHSDSPQRQLAMAYVGLHLFAHHVGGISP